MDADPLSPLFSTLCDISNVTPPAVTFTAPTFGVCGALLVALSALLFSAFFSSSEIAFFSLTKDEIEEIEISHPHHIVIIDEAYVDFGGESAVSLIHKYDNLLVTQTFSKSRCMAGARLGFGIGAESLNADLRTIKFSTNPYNVNRMTAAAGLAAIKENEYYMENCKKIIEARELTRNALLEMGLDVTNSKANFLFAKSDKISGEELYLKLKQKGVLVRHFKTDKIKEYNRIPVGTWEQMETFLARVREIHAEKEKNV